MSYIYDEYLHDHVEGVIKALAWMIEHKVIPDDVDVGLGLDHDASKRSKEEYDAYDRYFYKDKSFSATRDFKYAWLHHIHNNPHHWQYWVLLNDDEPEEALEIPLRYVYEMIADWWSFSWKSKNLYEIFDWYEAHKDMKLHPTTRDLVEKTLKQIRDILDEGKDDKDKNQEE